MISADTKEFEMKNEYTNKMMVLSLQTTKPLDFEYRMFYKLLFNITSIDTRGNTRTVTQTILVSLEDVGDNPPYWMNYFPTFRFLEGDPGRDMFRVEARDRDVMINNLIKYKISEACTHP
ncbi:cadherin-99C-like [Homarus americanus]|uniref:cadherin-99C-like n=1 Tax=Homarus americanus TaxID=6706 RepID=UPI001C49662D|nr:cadherin-99C-like [Homarus americanus]